MSLTVRLTISLVVSVLVGVTAAQVAGARSDAGRAERDLRADLEREARLVAEGIANRPIDLSIAAHRYGTLLGRRVSFIDEQGVVLGDSEFDESSLELLDNHLDRPEVQSALRTGIGTSRRLSASTNREEFKVAVAAWPGVVRISAPSDLLVSPSTSWILAGLLGVIAGLAVGFLLTAGWTSRATRVLETGYEAIRAKGGSSLPALRSGLKGVDRLLLSMRVYAQNVNTELEDLKRENAQTRTVIDGMGEGVLAADAQGQVVQANRSARDFLGLGALDHQPSLRELFHEADARAVVDAVQSGTVEAGREVHLRGRPVLMTARPLPEGGSVVALLDLTDAHRIQAVRRDFVANVSHELKTPLTSILGYAETLLDEDVEPTLRSQFLTVVRDNAVRMRGLVEDLLNLARVESGAWTPQRVPVDVAAMARDAWTALGGKAGASGVALDLPEETVTVDADREAMQTVLTNLFDNAVRHTPEGGRVTVTVESNGVTKTVVVADSGSGVPAEHIPRLFERFYRVDPGRSRDEGGTGLGLSIVRHLVEVHGGNITVDSEPGRGTTVRMTFPNA